MTKDSKIFKETVDFIKSLYKKDFIPLHEPVFCGNEKKYLAETIDSTFVSSVGIFVDKSEELMAEIYKSKGAVAIVNGSSALHLALIIADVKPGTHILTQSLTFVATSNVIKYQNANPIYIDIDQETLGMSPEALQNFLNENCEIRDGKTYCKLTGKEVSACVPVHIFGLACKIDEIVNICKNWNIKVIEDAAESIGTTYKNKMTGTFGDIGIVSFNGNKTITCGGGGFIISDNDKYLKSAKHLSTQAKIPHKWNYEHDFIGYNYRLPNLNAALLCAQLEYLDKVIENKRETHKLYKNFFENTGIKIINELTDSISNYWLNAILFSDSLEKENFLEYSNANGVMTRPAWKLMFEMNQFSDSIKDDQKNSRYIADKLVNIPSSFRL